MVPPEIDEGVHLLVVGERLGLERGNVNFLVALLLPPERSFRQLAALVGHEVRPVGEGQVFEAEHLGVAGVGVAVAVGGAQLLGLLGRPGQARRVIAAFVFSFKLHEEQNNE